MPIGAIYTMIWRDDVLASTAPIWSVLAWMAGTSPAMTSRGIYEPLPHLHHGETFSRAGRTPSKWQMPNTRSARLLV